MTRYRHKLPQLAGGLFLTDAGLETDIIFNHGIEIREFAAHTLLDDLRDRAVLENYFRGFIGLAEQYTAGFILDTVTWKAHRHWASDLGESIEQLAESNREAVRMIASLREASGNTGPIVLNAPIGPRGDAYRPDAIIEAQDAADYYDEQLGWLADTEIDMVTGLTFTQAGEAEGLVLAAKAKALPVVISFTVETDGRLPTGQPLSEAIEQVDRRTAGGPAYYMVNCAHPDHFTDVLRGGSWRNRIRGIRANASRCSHAELDGADELDAGNPVELGQQYSELKAVMPWLNVFGACCGADLRHVAEIAKNVRS